MPGHLEAITVPCRLDLRSHLSLFREEKISINVSAQMLDGEFAGASASGLPLQGPVLYRVRPATTPCRHFTKILSCVPT
jgi:hypothetical protein